MFYYITIIPRVSCLVSRVSLWNASYAAWNGSVPLDIVRHVSSSQPKFQDSLVSDGVRHLDNLVTRSVDSDTGHVLASQLCQH